MCREVSAAQCNAAPAAGISEYSHHCVLTLPFADLKTKILPPPPLPPACPSVLPQDVHPGRAVPLCVLQGADPADWSSAGGLGAGGMQLVHQHFGL